MNYNFKKTTQLIRGSIGYTLLILNTIFIFLFFLPIGTIKKISKSNNVKKACLYLLHKTGFLWVHINFYIVKIVGNLKFNIDGGEHLKDLPKDKWYLLISNHQSWTDVLILQFIFKKNLPFQKYFVKEQMRKFPVMGFVWDAIDCPFLKRSDNKNNDSNSDIELIKEKSKKFKLLPASIVSFVEGTRYSTKKHAEQNSAYKHLLKPKAGGIACVLSELNREIKSIIDTTLCYVPRNSNFWDLFSGRLHNISVKIKVLDVPKWLQEKHEKKANYSEYKQQMQDWLHEMWLAKDEFLAKHY